MTSYSRAESRDLATLPLPVACNPSQPARHRLSHSLWRRRCCNRPKTFVFCNTERFIERPFVKRFALCYRTVVLSCILSVTLVHCGQTLGWIKMKLGIQIGLGPGHTMLDGDPASHPKGAQPQFQPISAAAKWLDVSRCHSVWRKDSSQATLC